MYCSKYFPLGNLNLVSDLQGRHYSYFKVEDTDAERLKVPNLSAYSYVRSIPGVKLKPV